MCVVWEEFDKYEAEIQEDLNLFEKLRKKDLLTYSASSKERHRLYQISAAISTIRARIYGRISNTH